MVFSASTRNQLEANEKKVEKKFVPEKEAKKKVFPSTVFLRFPIWRKEAAVVSEPFFILHWENSVFLLFFVKVLLAGVLF